MNSDKHRFLFFLSEMNSDKHRFLFFLSVVICVYPWF